MIDEVVSPKKLPMKTPPNRASTASRKQSMNEYASDTEIEMCADVESDYTDTSIMMMGNGTSSDNGSQNSGFSYLKSKTGLKSAA